MKKVIPFICLVISLMSCQQGEKNSPYMKFPEFKTSQEDFKNKISLKDSITFNTSYESVKNLFKDNSTNKLAVNLYSQLGNLNELSLDQQGAQIHKLALDDISNIQNYQVLEINWFDLNNELKYTKEFPTR